MKQPSWKMPLILSGTLMVFGGFAYWLQYSHKPKKDKEETLTKKPLSLPNENTQIVRFKVKSAKGLIEGKCEDVSAKKCVLNSNANWTLTYPTTLKGDSENIKEFISGAANVLSTENIDLRDETPEKRKKLLDEYGLSDEKRTSLGSQFIEFTLEDGKRITAWFGVEHPLGEKTFVARAENGTVDDKTIYMISNFFKSNFDHGTTYFRDKTVFNLDRNTIDGFKVRTAKSNLDAKKINGIWSINNFAGDSYRIDSYLTSFMQLKAREFPETDVLKGLKPVGTFSLLTGNTAYDLSLYEKRIPAEKNSKQPPKSIFYAKASTRPEVMEVEGLFETQVMKKLSDLRLGILMNQAEKVTADQVKFEGKNLKTPAEFKYEGGNWVQKSQGAKWDVSKVSKLLDLFVETRVKDFVPSPAGKKDQIRITVGDSKNPTKFDLIFYTVKDQAYAEDQNSKDKQAKLLEPDVKMALPFTEDAWKMK